MQSQAPTVYIITYGCKVNYYESEAVASNLDAMGIPNQMVSDGAISRLLNAGAFVVNSCAVTSMAEKKSRYGVSKIKKYHPHAAVVTMGCAFGRKTSEMVALEVAELLKELPSLGANAPQMVALEVADKIHATFDTTRPILDGAVSNSQPAVTVQHRREKAFIKIQDGCKNFCTYCIIPYLRDKVECRPIDDVVAEIRAQASHVTAVVLCGINLCYYPDFDALCRAVDDCGVAWEISSLEPPMMTDQLIATLKQCTHFVPHFHICLQSGCDDVLRDMNRHYTTREYADIIQKLRTTFSNATFGTDLIVGFPTETDAAFETTLAFLKTLKLDKIHVFPYSPRVGTPAATMKPVPNAVVTDRIAKIRFT